MINGQHPGNDGEAVTDVPRFRRAQSFVWPLLLTCGLVTGLYRESGTFSRLKGPVGVHLEFALETSVFNPPSGDVPLRVTLWIGVIICALVLRRLRLMNWPAAGILAALAIVAMWVQSSLWRAWADQVQSKLDQFKYVIAADNIDWDRFYCALGQEAGPCLVTYQQGQCCVWIYPRIERREDRVVEMMEQAGFGLRKAKENRSTSP